MRTLIEFSGGLIEDDCFVVEPGCIILSKTSLSENAPELFRKLGISDSLSEESQQATFESRLCYLSFAPHLEVEKRFDRDSDLLGRIIQQGHLSVFAGHYVSFLVAGVSDEIVKEFVAHSEAKVSRVTSSNCVKMNTTFYRVWGSSPEVVDRQKECVKQFLKLRETYLLSLPNSSNTEEINMFNLGMKASAFTFTMSLKDYHKLFIGRLPESGNEHDVRLICEKMCQQLHHLYPTLIKEPAFYGHKNNYEKYTIK